MVEVPVAVCWVTGCVICVLTWISVKSQRDCTERISEFQRTILHSTIAYERTMLKESMSVYREAYQEGLQAGMVDAHHDEGTDTDG